MIEIAAHAWTLVAFGATGLFAAAVAESTLRAPGGVGRGTWGVTGIGGGHGLYHLTVSPVDPRRVLAASGRASNFVTVDGGDSWRMFNLRRDALFFAWDPKNADVAYAAIIGLYRTRDAGRTWALVHPNPSSVSGLIQTTDDAETEFVRTDDGRDLIVALAVDPDETEILYAVMSAKDVFTFCVSTDWGNTWTQEADLPWGQRINVYASGGRKLYVDPSSPRRNRTVYAIGDCQVSVRESGRWKHHYPPNNVPAFTEAALGFPGEGRRPVIYAIAEMSRKGRAITGGLFISTDGGESWRTGNGPIVRWTGRSGAIPNLRAVATCLNDPNTAYLSLDHLRMDDENEDVYGIAKTVDGGRSWELKVKETYLEASPRIHDAWCNEFFGPEWGESPVSMCIAPSNRDVLYTGDMGRLMRSTDGLETLAAAYSRRTPQGTFVSTGIDVSTCYGVHFNPFDPQNIIVSCADTNLIRSHDGGASWTKSAIPWHWRNTTYWVLFDPEVKGRAWAAMSSIHDLPRPRMWRGIGTGHYEGGVAVSEDAGKTWTKSAEGMRPTAVTHVILDPGSPKDARTLYAAGFGTGVWKSVDGGRTWALKNNGIRGQAPFAWRLVDDGRGVIYLVVARRSEDGSIGGEGDGAVYRSADGAEAWQPVALPEGVNGPNGLAIDPDDPRRMYLATWGVSRDTGDINGGIYLTTDGAGTWRHVESKYAHAYDVTIDPRDARVMYSCGFNSAVLRSSDRGETWVRLKGFNVKWGHRVACDPGDPERIFVTTFGASVWYGPACGDPSAADEIVTPAIAYS